MYINGLYINGFPQKICRTEDYVGIDVLVGQQPENVLNNIISDYKEKGNEGFIIWGTQWPKDIKVLNSGERTDKYKELSIDLISKELLFFRNIELNNYKDVLIIHGLEKSISSLNLSYVLKQAINQKTLNECQVIFIISMNTYQDYKVNQSFSSKVGTLII